MGDTSTVESLTSDLRLYQGFRRSWSLSMNKQLHWTQRVALVRHTLHSASRSGDFTFFKTLQAAGLMEGTNHVATLSHELGDDADTILAAMDNLNAGLAYVHQDAFQNVYDSLKNTIREAQGGECSMDTKLAKLYVDTTLQRNMADMAIDKMTNSAVALVNQQPENVQETAANVWIMGATIIADCMEITLHELESLGMKLEDFIRIEESYNTVKASVVFAVTGLRGVFSLMDQPNSPTSATSSASGRSASIASASAGMFRRLSSAFAPSTQSSRASSITSLGAVATSRSGSMSVLNNGMGSFNSFNNSTPIYRTPNYVRNSVSAGCPTSMPPPNMKSDFKQHKLSTVPPTPAADENLDPFDTSAAPPMPSMPEIPPMAAMPHVPMEGNQTLIGLV